MVAIMMVLMVAVMKRMMITMAANRFGPLTVRGILTALRVLLPLFHVTVSFQ